MTVELLRRAAAEMRANAVAWHPAVVLAIADWLEEVAAWRDEGLGLMPMTNLADAWGETERSALAVAVAYLGRDA